MKCCKYQSYLRDKDFVGIPMIKCKKHNYERCLYQRPCDKLGGKWILNETADKYCKDFENNMSG